MSNPTARWDEVDELLGHADSRIVQEIVDTGASNDELGAAIDELETARGSQLPSPRVAQIRKILEGMRRGLDEEGTMPIGGMLI